MDSEFLKTIRVASNQLEAQKQSLMDEMKQYSESLMESLSENLLDVSNRLRLETPVPPLVPITTPTPVFQAAPSHDEVDRFAEQMREIMENEIKPLMAAHCASTAAEHRLRFKEELDEMSVAMLDLIKKKQQKIINLIKK